MPRLSLPGVAHYLLQRGHNGAVIVRDVQDVEALLQSLREAALSHGVTLHAYAVAGPEFHVLATPDTDGGTGRMMQSLGRRFAAGFNRRHGRTGGLWDGRFRSALVEEGVCRLTALRQIDALSLQTAALTAPEHELAASGQVVGAPSPAARLVCSSAPHRTGGRRDPALVDLPEFWALGNTPFERESRYRALLAEPLPADAAGALMAAVRGGWAYGGAAFLHGLGAHTPRRATPRPRGRPRRAP